MYGSKWPFLLMYVSRDTKRIDFLQVDGLSTDPRDLVMINVITLELLLYS